MPKHNLTPAEVYERATRAVYDVLMKTIQEQIEKYTIKDDDDTVDYILAALQAITFHQLQLAALITRPDSTPEDLAHEILRKTAATEVTAIADVFNAARNSRKERLN